MDKDREMETTERWIKTERWKPQYCEKQD